MDFNFVIVNNKYVSIDYDSYTPNKFELSLVDHLDESGFDFYLASKNDILGEYRFYTKKFNNFEDDKYLIIIDKLNKLLNSFITYEKYETAKIINIKKTMNYIKISETISFLETLLKDFEEDDRIFKKIGDFIKHLEEDKILLF